MAEMTTGAPLDGILVADFSRILAGPLVGQTLADLGADVIKVERAGVGDDTRQWGPPWWGDVATYFAGLNHSKRSVGLDLTAEKDQAIALELCRRADVVIENFRPGAMDRLGLGVDAVRAINPGVVYASISGFGQDGEASELPGVDLILQAMSGWMEVTGHTDGPPTKVGFALVDVVAGLNATVGILAALNARGARGGRGDVVQVSLMDAALSGLVNQASGHVMTGAEPMRDGNRHPSIAPYEPLRTADRPIVVAAVNDTLYAKFCGAIERAELIEDERFTTNTLRRGNVVELIAELEITFVTKGVDEWLAILMDAGVPCGPVNTVGGAFEWADAMGMEPVAIDEATGYKAVRSPIRFVDHEIISPKTPPELDEHGDDIRAWLA